MTTALLLFALALALPAHAAAADWGGIQPGVSTVQDVKARYGEPSAEKSAKVEGYDTLEWVYDKAKAPAGVNRMTVEFGLLTPSGYKPSLVRLLKLEPRPSVFGRKTVIQGWGVPDAVGSQDGLVTVFYKEGLFVVLDQDGENALTMIFSIPQPDTPAAPAPPAAAPKR